MLFIVGIVTIYHKSLNSVFNQSHVLHFINSRLLEIPTDLKSCGEYALDKACVKFALTPNVNKDTFGEGKFNIVVASKLEKRHRIDTANNLSIRYTNICLNGHAFILKSINF